MAEPAGRLAVLKALASHPRVLKARPRTIGFLCRYMRAFRIQKAGRNLIIHSHLPPLNSRAYGGSSTSTWSPGRRGRRTPRSD